METADDSYLKSSIKWTVILKTLADETRLQIIHVLLNGEASVQDIATSLDIKVYNVSKHLKILESCGLVKKRKEGTQRIYGITDRLMSRLSEDKQVLDLGCCKFLFTGLKK
ncbi:MAG: metalloregulator ArsR/SmtB family transcription factor [Thermodesulfovibrionia bacterium]|nr:metalloregulator ArsR/SmtB family transcription factor [Thermodesulfovibrionia bacterium]